MAQAVEMPKMSDTMEEGVLVAWHVKEGDAVKAGDILAEVETDKATMELESYFTGEVLHIARKQGDAVPVGSLIVVIGKKGEDISAIVAGSGGSTPAPQAKPEAAAPQAQPAVVTAPPVAITPVMEAAPATDTQDAGRIKASPLAKAIAKDKGVDLHDIKGSGENGRIVKRDLETAQPSTATQPGAPQQITSLSATAFEDLPISQMRKTIARRLSESKFTAPHFYLTLSIQMDRAAAFRKEVNAEGDKKISFNDLVVKACAAALRKHPAVNTAWLGDKLRRYNVVNIGIAVAVEDGLLVPVIRNADQKGLETISAETRLLAERARTKQLQPQEWEGNTFTISNLGMFGIEEFTAIINPPDSCIMAVGGIKEEVIVEKGEMKIAQIMKVTLSCDHRVVDGATGAQFLQTVKAMLENPLKMLL